MSGAGKAVILGMFALGLASTGFGLWYHHAAGRQAMQLYGTRAAQLIIRAETTELWRLAPAISLDGAGPPTAGDVLLVENRPLAVLEKKDITAARGLSHARRALLEDRSYDWTAAHAACEPDWRWALIFVQGDETVTLLVSIDCPRVHMLESGASASPAQIAPALETFFGEQFP